MLLTTAALLAFGVWALLLAIRSHDVRRDLERRLAWLEEVRRVQTELEPWRGPSRAAEHGPLATLSAEDAPSSGDAETTAAPTATDAPTAADAEVSTTILAARPPVDALRPVLSDLGSLEGDRALQVAVLDLRRSLAELAGDGGWDASQRALSAATSLEARLQHQVSAQLRNLDRHWRSFDLLVISALLLALTTGLLVHRGQRRRTELDEALRAAAVHASHDRLTGLWNREAILKLLRDELARSDRSQSPVGVILIDLDHFKQINTLLGEEQGDFILQQLADRLSQMVRPYDALGRLGGDSFLVVLPACDAIATGNVARRLRSAVNDHDVEHALGRVRVTLSLAFTTIHHPGGLDAALLAHRLDDAMVRSRREHGPAEGAPGHLVAVDEDPAAA